MTDTTTHEVSAVVAEADAASVAGDSNLSGMQRVVDLTESNSVVTPPLNPPTRSHPVRPVLDAKVRARRIALKRAAGRRRLRRLQWVAGVTLTVLAVWLAFRSPLLDVDNVNVIGLKSALPESVAKLARINHGMAMIDVDTKAVAQRVLAVPYVKFVEVNRDWPGTVTIKVTERTPIVAVSIGQEFAFLDDEDVYFRTSAVRPTNLIVVNGITGLTKPGDVLKGSATAIIKFAHEIPLAAAELLGIESINQGETGVVTINLLSGQIVIVGDPTQARAKLLAVAAVLQTDKGKVAHTLDVQVPELPVVGA